MSGAGEDVPGLLRFSNRPSASLRIRTRRILVPVWEQEWLLLR